MPAMDDGAVVKLYNSSTTSPIVDEVMIGTPGTGASQRLASFVTTINGTPEVKSYISGTGVYTGDVVGAVTGNVTGNVDATAITAATISVSDELTSVNPDVTGTEPITPGTSAQVTAAVRHVVHKVHVVADAFSAAGASLTSDVTIWTLPDKCRVLRVVADVTEEFKGGAISASVLRVGKAADGNEYLVDADVFAAPIVLGNVAAERGASLVDATVSDLTWGATQIVNARLTTTTANVEALTQGVMTVYIECCVYP